MDVDAACDADAARGATVRLIRTLHDQLLPTSQCLDRCGGVSGWCSKWCELQHHCEQLQDLLPSACKHMLLNLKVLAELATAAQASQ